MATVSEYWKIKKNHSISYRNVHRKYRIVSLCIISIISNGKNRHRIVSHTKINVLHVFSNFKNKNASCVQLQCPSIRQITVFTYLLYILKQFSFKNLHYPHVSHILKRLLNNYCIDFKSLNRIESYHHNDNFWMDFGIPVNQWIVTRHV